MTDVVATEHTPDPVNQEQFWYWECRDCGEESVLDYLTQDDALEDGASHVCGQSMPWEETLGERAEDD